MLTDSKIGVTVKGTELDGGQSQRVRLCSWSSLVALAVFGVIVGCDMSNDGDDASHTITTAKALLNNPERFASKKVAVSGHLEWHSDEAVLFSDLQAFSSLDFGKSLMIENSEEFDISFYDEKPVTLLGTFIYSEKPPNYEDYSGFLRVEAFRGQDGERK